MHTPRKSNSWLVLLNTNAGEKSEMFIVGAGQPVRRGRLWSTTWKEELLGKILSTSYAWYTDLVKNTRLLLHLSWKDGGPQGGLLGSSSQNG